MIRERSTGQALAEFALVIPIFLALLYGIVEFGRYVYFVQILNNAAREGARYAIVHGSQSLSPSGPMPGGGDSRDLTGENIKRVVRDHAVGLVPGTITFPAAGCVHSEAAGPCWAPNNQRGNTVTVAVRATYNPLIPIFPLPPISVDGASTLVVNH